MCHWTFTFSVSEFFATLEPGTSVVSSSAVADEGRVSSGSRTLSARPESKLKSKGGRDARGAELRRCCEAARTVSRTLCVLTGAIFLREPLVERVSKTRSISNTIFGGSTSRECRRLSVDRRALFLSLLRARLVGYPFEEKPSENRYF